jgi:RNA polymerase sigma factor (sigma-70 family)
MAGSEKEKAGTSAQRGGTFVRTQWSDVLKAASDSQDATQAFERLAKAYWHPLYAFVRRRGYQPADADDLVQGFFEFLIAKKPLESVDPAKGRFRAFLRTVLCNFLANQQASQKAQKRGGGRLPVPLDDLPPNAQADAGLAVDCSPDEVFDADWAETLVGHAVSQLKAEYETAGRASVFEKLNPFLSPLGGQASYATVARDLDMSEDAVRMAVNRLRRRFRELLRARIAETVSSQEDLTEEYRYLSQVLTRKRP